MARGSEIVNGVLFVVIGRWVECGEITPIAAFKCLALSTDLQPQNQISKTAVTNQSLKLSLGQ
jgi:hypothetical protein